MFVFFNIPLCDVFGCSRSTTPTARYFYPRPCACELPQPLPHAYPACYVISQHVFEPATYIRDVFHVFHVLDINPSHLFPASSAAPISFFPSGPMRVLGKGRDTCRYIHAHYAPTHACMHPSVQPCMRSYTLQSHPSLTPPPCASSTLSLSLKHNLTVLYFSVQ